MFTNRFSNIKIARLKAMIIQTRVVSRFKSVSLMCRILWRSLDRTADSHNMLQKYVFFQNCHFKSKTKTNYVMCTGMVCTWRPLVEKFSILLWHARVNQQLEPESPNFSSIRAWKFSTGIQIVMSTKL
jgi:hypothetical protein